MNGSEIFRLFFYLPYTNSDTILALFLAHGFIFATYKNVYKVMQTITQKPRYNVTQKLIETQIDTDQNKKRSDFFLNFIATAH